MLSKRRPLWKGLTIIEMAFVILIISVLISGTILGNNLIKKARLSAAKALAQSSPVLTIPSNVLWLETSLNNSIQDSQSSNGETITSWHDQSNTVAVTAVGQGPTYANSINDIHAIKFIGSHNDYLQIADAYFLNNTDYTIMVVEKRQSAHNDNYFIGETSSNPNDNLALGYSLDSVVIHAQGNDSYDTDAIVSSYTSSPNDPRVFTFIHSATSGNSTYINGMLAAQDTNKTDHIDDMTSLAIGKGYTGEIGEIAIYTRALRLKERQEIENYLSQKWSIELYEESCIGYPVTKSGCDVSNTTCIINLVGSTNTGTVDSGDSGDIACDVSGYSGTVSYSCDNTVMTYNTTCGCDLASGYLESEGSCILGQSCSTAEVAGISTPTAVDHMATGTLTCDTSNHYTGSVTYDCDDGTLNPTGECDCESGYIMVDGVCEPICSASVTPNNTAVPGDLIYSFTADGTFSCLAPVTAEILVVAGGGAGGANAGGGGGGGGVVYKSSLTIPIGSYTVDVGAGGVANSSLDPSGRSGENSSIDITGVEIAIGGGGGSSRIGRYQVADGGDDGGSGGGGGGGKPYDGGGVSSETAYAGSGTSGQGNRGGTGYASACSSAGGGGGGAGSAGKNSYNANAGNGGAGRTISITGSSVVYGSGGGGGRNCDTGGQVGNGGVGAGKGGKTTVGGNATGRGSGGGGGGGYLIGGNGNSGIVIIRYSK